MTVVAFLGKTTAATVVTAAFLAALEVGIHAGSAAGSGGTGGGDVRLGLVMLHSE